MKLKAGRKYEACIAKTTLSREWKRSYYTVGKWYPVEAIRDRGEGDIFFEATDEDGDYSYHCMKNDAHLDGGNWKIRQVKEEVE